MARNTDNAAKPPEGLSDEDRKLWKEAMQGDFIQPAPATPPPSSRKPSRKSKPKPTAVGAPPPLKPDAKSATLYYRPGVPAASRDTLRGGGYTINSRLDLHLLTEEEARLRLPPFLRTAALRGSRCVLVITGKGKHSAGGAVLKPMVHSLLRRTSEVQAFCPARPHHGGDGAFYVLL